MKNSLIYQVQQLLKLNKITFDKNELAFQIESHPSYPSLYAITGVLDHFNVDNLALDVPVTEETLKQLPKSFLAQIKTDYDTEFVVVKNNGLKYEVIYNNKKKSTLSLSAFLEKFTGIIVAIEKNEESLETGNSRDNLTRNKIIISILLFCIHYALLDPSINSILFFIISIIGLYISYATFKQEQGEESFLGNAFCSDASEKKDCAAVLNSKGAKVFENYKLSNLSLVYFSGLSISIYLLTILKTNLSFPLLISIIAIPITIYSLYYQYFIVKQWCLLCLSIVIVLWGQALIAIINFNNITFSSLENLLIIGFAFSLAFVAEKFIFSFIKTKNEFRKTKVEYYKFKNNFSLFNSLLEKSEIINTTLNTSEIIFGNRNAKVNITIITNPFCGHCRVVHSLVENIYKKYSNDVHLCIRFNVNVTNPQSHAVKITSRLLELYENDTATCLNAMHDIYKGLKPKKWLEKWKNCYNSTHYMEVLKKESDWCKKNNINFTPEILINGKSFPKEYDRSDLIYFIDDLIEQNESNSIELTKNEKELV